MMESKKGARNIIENKKRTKGTL